MTNAHLNTQSDVSNREIMVHIKELIYMLLLWRYRFDICTYRNQPCGTLGQLLNFVNCFIIFIARGGPGVLGPLIQVYLCDSCEAGLKKEEHNIKTQCEQF